MRNAPKFIVYNTEKHEMLTTHIQLRNLCLNSSGNVVGHSLVDGKIVCFDLDEYVALHFIGIYDFNSNPIYEGDILVINDKSKVVVEYSDEEACFYGYDEYTGHSYYFGRMEDKLVVVGNIYRNSKTDWKED